MNHITHVFIEPGDTIDGNTDNGYGVLRIASALEKGGSEDLHVYFGVHGDPPRPQITLINRVIDQLHDMRNALIRAERGGGLVQAALDDTPKSSRVDDRGDASHIDGRTASEAARDSQRGMGAESSPTYRSDMKAAGRGSQLR